MCAMISIRGGPISVEMEDGNLNAKELRDLCREEFIFVLTMFSDMGGKLIAEMSDEEGNFQGGMFG